MTMREGSSMRQRTKLLAGLAVAVAGLLSANIAPAQDAHSILLRVERKLVNHGTDLNVVGEVLVFRDGTVVTISTTADRWCVIRTASPASALAALDQALGVYQVGLQHGPCFMEPSLQ